MGSRKKTIMLTILSAVATPALGVLFLWAAYHKIVEPIEFLESVRSYRLTSMNVTVAIAFILPYMELILGVSLLSGFIRQGSLCMAGLLCIVFFIAQISVIARGIEIDCGCFGQRGESVGLATVARTLIILLLTSVIYWSNLFSQRRNCQDSTPDGGQAPGL
jgi:putative oxidoreductase